ncbi:MAG TPA: YCF48-related protein [Gaiella sp.]
MRVYAPPRPPDSGEAIDRAELEALIEALIEEARRRARRRRRRASAAVLLVALAVGGVYFGFDHVGGGAVGTRSAQLGSTGGAAPAASSAGRWAPSHGPYGGALYVVAVAPSDPDVVYLGTAMGVYSSRDAARSWQSAGLGIRTGLQEVLGLRITSLAVDPRAPGTVYATRSRWVDGGTKLRQELFKSADGGQSWHSLGLAAQRVAVSPADPTTVFAVVGANWTKNRLFRSTDGGRTWRPVDRGLGATSFSGLGFDPTHPARVYAATRRGLLISADGGGSWRRADGRLARRAMSAVAVDPRHPQTLYAGTDSGVIGSLDGGRSWRMLNAVLGGHGRDRGYGEVSSLVVDPHHRQRVYATVGCLGIFKSTDGGRRWHAVNASRDFSCLDSSLALDPRTPQRLYSVYPGRGGVFTSTDSAEHWHAANGGLALSTVSSLAVDPHHPRIVYASAGVQGLFESHDGGAHWLSVAPGLESANAVALDPRDTRIVLAAGSVHRLVRSTDAGRTWHSTRAGISARAQVLAISGQQAYAGTAARGVFTSADGGRSWQGLPGPGNDYVQALAIDPDDPAVVYAGSMGSKARGLYKSSDGGRSWQRLTDALEDSDIFAIALDPTRRTTVYIGTGGGGIFKSADGGVSWQPASTGLPRITLKVTMATGKVVSATKTVGITALAVDPAKPTTLYAATGERGIFRSTDAGASWRPFNSGLPVLDVRSLAVDAAGRILYAGTVNGGVVAAALRSR